MINRPWISYSLQQDSKDGEEGIVKLLQVREELTALLPRVTQRRSMAFEKFKELCIDIGFWYSRLLAAARVRLSLTVFPSPRSVAQFLPWTGEAVEKNIREYRLARFV